MAGPFLLAALESGVQLGSGAGLMGAISGSLFPTLNSLNIRNQQNGFIQYPVGLPSPGALMQLLVTGWAFQDEFGEEEKEGLAHVIEGLRRQGIAIGEDGYNNTEKLDWKMYKHLWSLVQRSSYVRPGIKEAITGKIAGFLSDKEFNRMMRRSGAIGSDWTWMLPFLSQRLTPDQVLDMYRRGVFNDEQFTNYMKQLQYGVPGDVEKYKQFANEIPGYQDIIRFAVREAFNPGQVTALGLDQELDQNPDFLDWARASGLGDVEITNVKGEKKLVNFAKLYWYAHWELPSPSQVYDFFHKYYADSPYGPSPYLKYAKPFGQVELNNLLKANDYSPAFRSHLAGAAFLPYTRIDVRRIRQAGLITEADVYHNYRASGYDDEHAKALTRWVEKDLKDKTTNVVKSGIKGELCKAYTLGIITNQDMQTGLVNAGFTADEAKAQSGLCDMKAGNAYAKEAVTTIKRNYLTGGFDEKEATAALRKYSFTDLDISRYLAIWNLKLDGTVRQTSTQMVTGWFIEGIIGLEEYVSRLSKMNYTPQDVTRIVQAAQYEQAKRLARAQKIAASEAQKQIEKNLRDADKARKEAEAMARQRQRELQRLQSAMQKEEADRFRRFLAGRTESNLRNWLADGSISEDEVRYTFNARGWNPVDIERWLQVEREKGT